LSGLKPPLQGKRESLYSDEESLSTWLNILREIGNTIQSTLSLPSQSDIAKRARLRWQKIRAVQMFTEHIVLNHADVIVSARRLNLVLGGEADFLTLSTVNKVKDFLNNMNISLKKQLKSEDKRKHLAAIRKSCTNFFIEVVCGLCFGQSNPPDDDLVLMLLDIVFTKQGEEVKEGDMWRHGTRDFTPFKDAHGDENPIIRSFLLQLLLEHNTKKVKVHLNAYFTRCQQALVGGVGVDQELSLLCVQCFEVSDCCIAAFLDLYTNLIERCGEGVLWFIF
jgi:hypothetical protein